MEKVLDWMCKDPSFVHIGDNAQKAVDIMERERLTLLPVVDEDRRFLGMISEREILRVAVFLTAASITSMYESTPLEPLVTVRELIDEHGVTISPDEEMSSAAAKLIECGLECLAVLEDSKLIGTLSHSDFTRLVASSAERIQKAA